MTTTRWQQQSVRQILVWILPLTYLQHDNNSNHNMTTTEFKMDTRVDLAADIGVITVLAWACAYSPPLPAVPPARVSVYLGRISWGQRSNMGPGDDAVDICGRGVSHSSSEDEFSHCICTFVHHTSVPASGAQVGSRLSCLLLGRFVLCFRSSWACLPCPC